MSASLDSISVLLGAASAVIGFLVGAMKRPSKLKLAGEYVCSCTHGLHDHDPQTNACHAEIGRTKHNDLGTDVGEVYVPAPAASTSGNAPLIKSTGPR